MNMAYIMDGTSSGTLATDGPVLSLAVMGDFLGLGEQCDKRLLCHHSSVSCAKLSRGAAALSWCGI